MAVFRNGGVFFVHNYRNGLFAYLFSQLELILDEYIPDSLFNNLNVEKRIHYNLFVIQQAKNNYNITEFTKKKHNINQNNTETTT